MIYKITPSVDYIKMLKRLDTPFNEPTNRNPIKADKLENYIIKLWGLSKNTFFGSDKTSFLFLNRFPGLELFHALYLDLKNPKIK